jgi:hypothetical protein
MTKDGDFQNGTVPSIHCTQLPVRTEAQPPLLAGWPYHDSFRAWWATTCMTLDQRLRTSWITNQKQSGNQWMERGKEKLESSTWTVSTPTQVILSSSTPTQVILSSCRSLTWFPSSEHEAWQWDVYSGRPSTTKVKVANEWYINESEGFRWRDLLLSR